MRILENFSRASKELINLLSKEEEQTLNKAPVTGGWTMAQVGDHLYRSYSLLPVLYGEAIAVTRAVDHYLDPLEKMFLDFTVKMEAPKEILPSYKDLAKPELLVDIKERLAEIMESARHRDLAELYTGYKFPNIGYLTGLEWIGFATFHTQRHNHQIRRILYQLKTLKTSKTTYYGD